MTTDEIYDRVIKEIVEYCELHPDMEDMLDTDINNFVLNICQRNNWYLTQIINALEYADVHVEPGTFFKANYTITGKQLESKGRTLSTPFPRNACVKPYTGKCLAWGANGYGANSQNPQNPVYRAFFETAQEAQAFLDKFITLPSVVERDEKVGHIEWKVAKTKYSGDYMIKLRSTECGPCLTEMIY